jgi:hypothetical protein
MTTYEFLCSSGSAAGTAAYVTSYLTKAKTEGLRKIIGAVLERVSEGSFTAAKLKRIGMAALSAREYSMQEATWLLTGMQLREASSNTVKLCIGYPQKRLRIVRTYAFRERTNEEDDAVATNVYDYYPARP